MVAELLVYTDGSCKSGDEAPGGWGFYIKPPNGLPIEGHGSATRTQAKVMEYTAVAEALAALPDRVAAKVFSDNESLVVNLDKKLRDWIESDFRNVDPSIVPIARRIASLISEKALRLTWQWVRSHNGNAGNQRADELARQGAREAKVKP